MLKLGTTGTACAGPVNKINPIAMNDFTGNSLSTTLLPPQALRPNQSVGMHSKAVRILL